MKSIYKLYSEYAYIILLGFLVWGLFDLRIGLIALVCMIAPIISGALGYGRFWCGNLCPRGSFYDKILKKLVPNKRKTPKMLKKVWFRILIIAILMGNFGIGMYKGWGDLYQMGLVIYRLILVTTVVAVILAAFYEYRTWCNFCPMGSFSAFATKLRGKKKAMTVGSKCVGCNICGKNCPMGIQVKDYKGNPIDHYDCIVCGVCQDKCPKKIIDFDDVNKDN